LIFQGDTNFCSAAGYVISELIFKRPTYFCPSRIKDFSPLPLPVEIALPPRAIVKADNTALLPPEQNSQNCTSRGQKKTSRHTSIVTLKQHQNDISIEQQNLRTNNEVDLRTKLEGKARVAHKLVHLDGFNDAHRSNTLN
jgi:hypothetical protein